MKQRKCGFCGAVVTGNCKSCQKEAEALEARAGNLTYEERLTNLRKYLYNPIMEFDFNVFHGAIEACMGRPVWTHEFAHPESLLLEMESRRPKSVQDVIMGAAVEYGEKMQVWEVQNEPEKSPKQDQNKPKSGQA